MQLKKILAAGAMGAMMALSTVGFATTLADFPAPFIEDGKPNTMIVVGATAATSDVVGAIDLAAGLSSVGEATEIGGTGTTTTTVSGESVLVQGTANDVNYNDALNGVDTKITDSDMPTILADGTVEDDSTDKEYDYEQEIQLSADVVKFGSLDNDEYVINTDLATNEIPVLYVDQSSAEAYKLVIEFDKPLNATALDDSEEIVIAGKTFTFDPNMEAGDDELVLYSSEETTTLNVGETATINDIEIEVVGANTDAGTAVIKVNGKAKNVKEGDKVGDIYISDIFTMTVPEETASVKFFVGSDKLVIEESGANTVEVDGEDLDGVKAELNAVSGNTDDVEAIDDITFTITPADMDEDEKKYLEIGEDFMDPLFGTFKMSFVAAEPALKEAVKSYTELKRSGDELKLTFTNREGEDYSFAVYLGDGTDITWQTDLWTPNTDLNEVAEDKILILHEGGAGQEVTKIYEVDDIKDGNLSTIEVKLKDLSSGTVKTYKEKEQIGDATAFVQKGADANHFDIDTTSAGGTKVKADQVIYTENDMEVTLGTPADVPATCGNVSTYWKDSDSNDEAYIVFEEATQNNIDETADVDEGAFAVLVDSDSSDDMKIMSLVEITTTGINFDADNETEGNETTGLPGHNIDFDGGNDDDNNIEYRLTEYGSYIEYDTDDDSYLYVWTPGEENDYKIYFSELASEVTTTTPTGNKVQTVTPVTSPLAVLDDKVTEEQKLGNLILVGGPSVNKLVKELLSAEWNTTDTYTAWLDNYASGEAMIELVEDAFGDGSLALIVAGTDAADTVEACHVLQNYDDYATEFADKKEVKVTTEADTVNVV